MGSKSRVQIAFEQYERLLFEHRNLDRVLDEVQRSIAPGMPPRIVLVRGPTGAGKTTVIEALMRRRASSDERRRKAQPGERRRKAQPGERRRKPQADLGLPTDALPLQRCSGTLRAGILYIRCPPVLDGRGYRFARSHWRLLADALGDPFKDEHSSPDAVGARLRAGLARRDGAASVDEYRLGVLDLIRERDDVRAVVLDEAQHMARVPSARSQADQLDVIKDSVDRTGKPHLLSGTYELSLMVAASDQLARRSWVVDFPPYGSSKSEQLAFQEILGPLVGALPLADPRRSWDELRGHLLDLYVGSLGCVGTLKEWLEMALRLALEAEAEFLDWPLMDRCRKPDSELLKIAQEIQNHRNVKKPTRADIKRALGLEPEVPADEAKNRSSGSPKPGKRSPNRDRVGLPPSAASVG